MNVTVDKDKAKQIESFIQKASQAGYTEDEIKGEIQRKYGRPAPAPQKPIDPTEGMSGMDKFLAGTGKAFYDIGRGTGQLAGDVAETVGFNRPEWSPTKADIDAARLRDAPLMKTGAGLGGNIFGNIAGLAPLALIPGANTIGGGAALGGIAGAMQPVSSTEGRGENAFIGGVAGGVVPAAVRGYKVGKAALIDPFTAKGKERIVGNVLNTAASDRNRAVANMAKNRGKTPGFNPTAGQASYDDGIASMERTARAIDPSGFQSVKEGQMGALTGAVKRVEGTPEARQAAVEAREQATNALYEQAKKAVAVDDGTLGELLKRPSMKQAMNNAVSLAKERGEFVVPKATTQAMPKSKVIDTDKDDLINAVRKLGGISDESFDKMFGQSVRKDFQFQPSFMGPVFSKQGGKGTGVDEITRSLYEKGYLQSDDVGELLDKLVDTHMYDKPAFSLFKSEEVVDPLADSINSLVAKLGERNIKESVPQSMLQGGKISGKALHDLKLGLDDAIGTPGLGGLTGSQQKAALGTKDAYMTWLEKNIPEYAAARTTYADMSKPINQMDIGSELYKRFVPALANTDDAIPFKVRADSYAQALQGGDQLARNVTGMKGKGLLDIMTPEQMGLLSGVRDDAAMVAAAQNAGRGVGSDTVQKMAMSNLMQQAGIPNWMQSLGRVPGGWLRTVGEILYTKNDEALKSMLADVIKDPQAAAQAMMMAKTDPTRFMQTMQTIAQGSAFALPSAVNANQ